MNKILLVEDNPGDIDLMRLAFDEAGIECELKVAQSGENALELLSADGDDKPRYRPDLILLDLNLPGMAGKEVLRNIKSHVRLRRIPVIAISSSAEETDVVQLYDLHVNSYVQKPLDMAGFVNVLRTIGEFWLRMAKLPPAAA